MTRDELHEAFGKLESAINAVAGCGMFAPKPAKSRDLPNLIEAMQDASVAFGDLLEAFGDGDDA
jgi:hypothetical protein